MAVAEGVHEFLQLCGAFDLEEDLVVVVRDLDVQMLGLLLLFRLRRGWVGDPSSDILSTGLGSREGIPTDALIGDLKGNLESMSVIV